MDMLTDFYLEKCESSAIILSQVRWVVFHYLSLHKHFFRKLTALVPLIQGNIKIYLGHEVLHLRDYKTILFSHVDLFYFNLAAPCLSCGGWDHDLCSMRDLQLQHTNSQLWHVGSISQTRDQTRSPALGAWSLSQWTTREVQPCRSDLNEI